MSEFRQAWANGDLVFPADPAAAGERWFLRTPVNATQDRDLTFIGINPSSATRFADQKSGGDPTIEMVQKFFPLRHDGAPCEWRTMTMINLIPVIGQPRDLPVWQQKAGRQTLLDTLRVTEAVLDTVLPASHCVHLMWGNLNDQRFPWKQALLEKITPQLLDLTPNAHVQAYLSKTQHPMHPGFGGLAHWRNKTLHHNARALLLTQR